MKLAVGFNPRNKVNRHPSRSDVCAPTSQTSLRDEPLSNGSIRGLKVHGYHHWSLRDRRWLSHGLGTWTSLLTKWQCGEPGVPCNVEAEAAWVG